MPSDQRAGPGVPSRHSTTVCSATGVPSSGRASSWVVGSGVGAWSEVEVTEDEVSEEEIVVEVVLELLGRALEVEGVGCDASSLGLHPVSARTVAARIKVCFFMLFAFA